MSDKKIREATCYWCGEKMVFKTRGKIMFEQTITEVFIFCGNESCLIQPCSSIRKTLQPKITGKIEDLTADFATALENPVGLEEIKKQLCEDWNNVILGESDDG